MGGAGCAGPVGAQPTALGRPVRAHRVKAATRVLAIPLVALAAWFELALLFPLWRWVYALAMAVVVACAAIDRAAATQPGPAQRRVVGFWWLLGIALLILHLAPWSSRKPFLQSLRTIRVGMTLPEVEAIMAGYGRGSGWRGLEGPLFADAVVFRHSDEARFNSDWGIVRFGGDKVVAVEFLPD